MTVCQICGDKGYSKLLIKCVQCRNIAVHRYCVLNPFFCEDEVINWSCEFCDPCTTEPTAIEQVTVQKTDRVKPKNKSGPPQSKKPNVSLKETSKEATDLPIIDQKNEDGSGISKHVKLKEKGSLALPPLSDATEDVGTDTGKGDNSNNEVDGCKQELPQNKGFTSNVAQEAVQKPDRKMPENNLDSQVSEKPNVSPKETVKEGTDLSIFDQKNEDGSVKSKQDGTNIEKGDSSNKDVDGCEQELPQNEGFTSNVEQEVVQKPDQKKAENNLSSQQSEMLNVFTKEAAKEATDVSMLDQKNEDGSVECERVKLKEKRSPVLPLVSDATDIGMGDSLNNEVDGCEQELPESEGLISTVEQVAVPESDQKKLENNMCPLQSEKPNDSPKETVKEATDLSILDLRNEDGSVKSKQDATDIQKDDSSNKDVDECEQELPDATDIGKGDSSNKDVDECEQESPKSEGLTSTVEQVAVPKPDGERPEINLSPSQSEKPNVSLKETAKEATDLSILDQKNEDGSVESKQVILKEKESPVLLHVSEVTNLEKFDNSNNDVDGRGKELPGVAVPKPDRKKQKNNLSTPQSEKPNVSLKETVKEATDPSMLDKKNKDGNLKSKQVKPKEKGSRVLPHVSDATEVVSATDIDKRDNSNDDVNEFKHKSLGSGKHPSLLKRLADAKKGKENNDSISDDCLKKGHSDADKVEEQEIKNVNLSDATGSQLPKLQQNLGSRKLTEGATDHGSAKRKQLKLKEKENPVLPHASETTEVVPATDTGKDDDSSIDVNERIRDLKQARKHSRRLKPSDDTEKKKKIEDSISDNGVKKASSDAVAVKKLKIKNVDSSDLTGNQQLKRQNNLGSQKRKDCSSPKKTDHTDVIPCNADKRGSGANKLNKSSSEVCSDKLKILPTNKNQLRDAELNDHGNTENSGVEKTVVDCAPDHLAVVQSIRDVSESKAPRKKRKVVIEMEYSGEDPVFVVSKHPQLVANRKDSPSHSSSEAVSKLSDGGLAQLSSIESIRHQPSPMDVDNRRLSQESSVVHENHIPFQPPPLNIVSYVPAQPLFDAAWRGYCNIADELPPKSLVLEAHLSTKAHEKVHGAVSVLPELLHFVFVPKKYAWPKSYERSPPTDDEIGLYFFPADERAEKLYFGLVNKMIDDDLVLKSVINNLELLVFCSVELPREAWSFQRQYYLWSVFRQSKDPILPNKQEHGIHQKRTRDFGNRHAPEFSDHAEHNHDYRGRSDRRSTRSRKWKDSRRSPRSNDSVLII